MNSLRSFIRESLLLEDVTTQITWQPPKKNVNADYAQRGEAGKLRTEFANLLRNARGWWRSAKYAYSFASASKGKLSAIKKAWSAGSLSRGEKWKIVGVSAALIGLVSWGILTWFKNRDAKPSEEELLVAEDKIKESYNTFMKIIKRQSDIIMKEFQTKSLIDNVRNAPVDTLIRNMQENYDSHASRLANFSGLSADKYQEFFSEFSQFESIKGAFDNEINGKAEGDDGKEDALKKCALVCLMYSAAYEISEAIIADEYLIESGIQGTENADIEKVRDETQKISNNVNEKFESDPEISTSVRYIESMTTGESP